MQLKCAEDMIKLAEEWGFLPLFRNNITGFSVEEHTPASLWFTDEEGPWEWKGPAARSGRCVYGKFFAGKAGMISLEMFPEFVNYRRDGYDFDARYDDGLASFKDKEVFDVINENGAILSKNIKKICGYKKDGKKGFETVITRLQSQTYVVTNDFVYMKDKHGNTYGWGVAEYDTPENIFGHDIVTSAYSKEPAESKEIIFKHLKKLLKNANEKDILKFIG